VAVTEAGRFVLADSTPAAPEVVARVIADEFAAAVRGERTQPIDVHRGVRIQRILAAVEAAIGTGESTIVDPPA
jgi:hypothetical protein